MEGASPSPVPAPDSRPLTPEKMIYLLSPAKTLDYDSGIPSVRATMPRFLDHSSELAGVMKKMKPADLEKLMGISSKLAELNAQRFDD